MKLHSLALNGQRRAAVASPDGARYILLKEAGLPDSLEALIAAGPPAWQRTAELAASSGDVAAVSVQDTQQCAPIVQPSKNVICVGKNYFDHAHEFDSSGFDASSTGSAVPEAPVIFSKAPSSIIGPGEAIVTANDPTNTVDYEGELAVVIATRCRHVKKAEALDHVFGYTIINDITARDVQKRHKQWFLGKSPDTFCPMGPCLVTADEIPDPTAMILETHVNGERRQYAPVRDLIFDIPTLIETITAQITLSPGDIIATGTPAGVGIGFNPPQFLKPGDTVEVTISEIGTLSNPVR